MIKTIADIYQLTETQLMKLERMGEKSATNLINSIEKSKSNELYRLINGLGIKYIGVKGAKVLAKSFTASASV